MSLNTYLMFNGRCEEAFRFYEKALDGKIVMMLNHSQVPGGQQTSSEMAKLIMHARLEVAGGVLMGSDAPCELYEAPKGFSVSILLNDAESAERAFAVLAENGMVRMPIQETFWAVRFGMLVDQFGVPWMVNCEKAA